MSDDEVSQNTGPRQVCPTCGRPCVPANNQDIMYEKRSRLTHNAYMRQYMRKRRLAQRVAGLDPYGEVR